MNRNGFILWLTGLPGAGKTTLGRRITGILRNKGYNVEILDGDEIRMHLSKGLGYSKEDRDTNIRRIGYVANLLARNGVIVIVAAVSPYRETRDEVRKQTERFVEVYVECPIEVLCQRDPKGLYAKAQQDIIPNFTGVSDPYEAPLQSEVRVRTDLESEEESTQKILRALRNMRYLEA